MPTPPKPISLSDEAMSAFGGNLLQNWLMGRVCARPWVSILGPAALFRGLYQTTHAHAYAAYAAIAGGGRQRNLASRLRFCAIAVSKTSSLAPLKPRNRSRSSLRMRFIWANRISTFLRSRRDSAKASVVANARTRSRISSSTSRVTLRTTAVVHFGLRAQLKQSFLLAL